MPPNASSSSGVAMTTRPGEACFASRRSTSSRFDSTAIATTWTRFGSSFPIQSSVVMQGGHHVAQNSTSTGLPRRSARENRLPDRSRKGTSGSDCSVAGDVFAERSVPPARRMSIIRARSC